MFCGLGGGVVEREKWRERRRERFCYLDADGGSS